MGPYGFCLALGVTGLAVMALLGFGHHGSSGSHTGHSGHAGHGHAGHGHAGHGHDAHAGHHGHDAGPGHHDVALGRLIGLLSPRVLFSFLVGVGATGLLARPFLIEPLLAAVALAGGVGFERLFVGPLWRFLFRFESRQAATLESAVMEEARAVTDFDARGQGLIALELDGQVVQLLGTLVAAEAGMPRIRSGDLVRIEEVDPVRNRCTVSFAGQRPKGVLP